MIGLSFLLHVAVLLLFLLSWPELRPPPDALPPPAVSMVFQSAGPHPPSVPNPTPDASVSSLPTPPAPPPAPPAAPPPAPKPAPPAVALDVPPPPARPTLDLPPPPDLPVPDVQTAEPLPLPPAPVAPPKPRPAPPVRQAERAPPRPNNGFPTPMNYSLGAPRAPSALERQFSSYAPGRTAKGDTSFSQFARVTKGHVDADWMSDLHRWWIQHRYYPPQAAMAGEDGTVKITIRVDRYGHVRVLDMLSRSGSQWIDMAAMATFRGADLPPFPPGSPDDEITVDLTINYILVGR